MNDFLIKGTIVGYSHEKWTEDKEVFSSYLLTVLQSWIINTYGYDGITKNNLNSKLAQEYGLIRESVLGLENDLHNLSIIIHQIKFININKDIDSALKSLYIGQLVESYFINIRSILDYSSLSPKILLDECSFDFLSSKHNDSLTDLIGKCKKDSKKIASAISSKIVDYIMNSESLLKDVQQIRDLIVHHGKEPIISIEGDNIYFNITNRNKSLLPNLLDIAGNDYPLFDYIRIITIRTIDYLENLGILIGNEMINHFDNNRINLTALGGICMPSFIEFLNYKK
ncbi:MAG TPA: hypothetical protein DCQ26_10525 [Marinilabiliales bacterium]|nr:MAG: hypothetical protein A2W84_00010 [Bacteroidetes bacterium GWC2_40_13]OFX72587.1 MAG: hypothetical protein A2W96_05100 [Bacteroidetes bacterium GWD2_40_43]OFX94125.1 MAG: hypothetical protein A2W97_17510 [Bacteroidetes bacterium GWE2_40_63]OFY20277.1 MAG: hypothetical protein A2W88_12480 [Bacteroidetes bacterium GWF2_40_13]OFZ24574.1 MAG: hypothetical protein A2437_16850 [Bacteroidetes bacterium RIFOXYC2_FULL_40_12]HAM99032.1 hypothetical protein [Marinilabiliales bacterium]